MTHVISTPTALKRLSKSLTGISVAFAIATTSIVTPAPARAGAEELLGALLVIGAACASSGKCKGKKAKRSSKKKSKSAQSGYGLTLAERRLVQEGLAAKGHYSSAIDGSFGAGTTKSISLYQAAIGFSVTGKLTPTQINDLAAASSSFSSLPDDSPMLFQSILVRDVSKAQLREIQVRLNEKNFPAGVPDGAWGGGTRSAVSSYKVVNGLPGKTIPSQRLLAHSNGVVLAREGGIAAKTFAVGLDGGVIDEEGQGVATFVDLAAKTDVEELPIAVAAVSALQFPILGMVTGMKRSQIEEAVIENLGDAVTILIGTAEEIGASGPLSLGHVMSHPNWPEPGSEQVVAIYNESAPSEGAVAIFRSIVMPSDFTEASFNENTIPDILTAYGKEGLVDDSLLWIGDSTQRAASRDDLKLRASCGNLSLLQPEVKPVAGAVSWSTKTAPMLDMKSASEIKTKCGDVFIVNFENGMLNFAVWNSDALASVGGASKAPKIKF